MNAETQTTASRTRSRLSLLTIFSLFAAPVILAWLAFYVFPEWVPEGTSNHGQLVSPVRPLPVFELGTVGGESVDNSFLRARWTFITLLQGECDKSCVQLLYKVRQVRLGQGKNIDRLQRLLLWDATGVAFDRQRELQEHFPGLVIADLKGEKHKDLLQVFELDDRNPLQAGRIYLVDPLGNLMMSYEQDDEPRGMLKDLGRLLKFSGLG